MAGLGVETLASNVPLQIRVPIGTLHLFEMMSRFLTPYQLNPFNYNPLRAQAWNRSPFG